MAFVANYLSVQIYLNRKKVLILSALISIKALILNFNLDQKHAGSLCRQYETVVK